MQVYHINDVMNMLGVGRYKAEQIINENKLALKRTKGQPYLVPKAKFDRFLGGLVNEA